MLTTDQQNRLKAMTPRAIGGTVQGGPLRTLDLDMLTNTIRRESPEKFHTAGVVNYGGGCPPDDAESLTQRRFYHAPAVHQDTPAGRTYHSAVVPWVFGVYPRGAE